MDNQSNNITESLVGKSVLVFGEDTRSFLTVIRSLANAGMLVDVNIYNKTSPANFSNCIRNSFNFNFQSMSIEEWKKAVTTLIIENHYDLVVPCDERAIFPLIEIRKNIEALTPALIVFGIPDSRLLKPLFNKVETRKVAEQNQIRVAKGAEVSLKEIDTGTLVQQFGLPLVVKPMQSYDEDELDSRNAVQIVREKAELQKALSTVDSEAVLIEEYFSGYGVGVSVLSKGGELKAAFAHARVAEPESGGGSSYRKAIQIEPNMLFAVEKFCKALNYTGIGMFEFKYNEKLNEWILIEINARFCGCELFWFSDIPLSIPFLAVHL